MKSTILHLLSLFLIVGFASSCGKKEGGGSSGSSSNNYNSGSNVNTTGAEALNNLRTWYQSTSEGEFPKNGLPQAIQVITKSKTINSSCTDLGWFGDFCVNKGGTWTTNPVVLVTRNTGSKSVVVDLKAALDPLFAGANPDSLSLPQGVNSITQKPSPVTGGSIFSITYVNSNQKIIFYQIDSGYNSAVNPVYKFDGINNTEKLLFSAY